jgi:hypothetical protein
MYDVHVHAIKIRSRLFLIMNSKLHTKFTMFKLSVVSIKQYLPPHAVEQFEGTIYHKAIDSFIKICKYIKNIKCDRSSVSLS